MSPKSKTEKDNNNNAPSRVIVSTVDNWDTWHTIVCNKRRPKYPMWLKDS